MSSPAFRPCLDDTIKADFIAMMHLERYQYVKIEGQSSRSVPLNHSVPQGSNLGPLSSTSTIHLLLIASDNLKLRFMCMQSSGMLKLNDIFIGTR